MGARQTATKKFRDSHRYQRRCIYCNAVLCFTGPVRNASADHIKPVAHGGSNGKSNLVICCKKCNCTRGHRTMEQWLSYMLRNVEQFPHVERLMSGEQVLPGMESY